MLRLKQKSVSLADGHITFPDSDSCENEARCLEMLCVTNMALLYTS